MRTYKKTNIVYAALLVMLLSFTGTAYCESLSDIKLDKLLQPAKKRWGKDPFEKQPYKLSGQKNEVSTPAPELKIDGIISDGRKFIVIIAGGFYRKNDKVGDFLIKDIKDNKIAVERNGQTYYLGTEKFALEGTPKKNIK